MKKIGEILKNAREDSDLTQLQVMKITGINNKTLSGYENGIAEPDIETMAVLFNLYNISADEALEIKKHGKSTAVRVTNQEKELLACFRRLSADRREDALRVFKALSDTENKE